MADSGDQQLRRVAEELKALEADKQQIPAPPTAGTAAGAAPVGGDPAAAGLVKEMAARAGSFESARPEAIIRWYRPILWVNGDQVNQDFDITDPVNGSADEIRKLLTDRKPMLGRVLPAIGRIEVQNNAQFEWVGTGWLIASELGDDIIVTNAHVATEFARRSQAGFTFRGGTIDFGFPQAARIDFRETVDRAPAREFAVTEIIWISDDELLDVAFLRVVRSSGDADRLAGPIPLSAAAEPGRWVSVIGYPGDDSRSYNAEQFHRLFGSMFGTKRLAPGRLRELTGAGLTHDCSTLPGNSGSALIDLESGAALGLHFSGAAFQANYAVPAAAIQRIIHDRPWQPRLSRAPQAAPTSATEAATTPLSISTQAGGVAITLPLEISVRLGGAARPLAGAAAAGTAGIEALAERLARQFDRNPAVLAVESGFLFRDGQLSDARGVIVKVRPGEPLDPAGYDLAPVMEGVEIALETADPETIVAELAGIVRERVGARRARYARDITTDEFSLDPITDAMRVTLHVSPEHGWSELERFLDGRSGNALTIGMYHMTAPHVVAAITEVARRRSLITLTLDRQRGDMADNPDDTGGEVKEKDIPERDTLKALADLGKKRFRCAPAALGASGLFNTAYHIKVAVWSDADRNGNFTADHAVWLSSGNWQSSNQPDIDAGTSDLAHYNREWHAVVEHEGVAGVFRRHLVQDFKDNAAFARREGEVERVPDILVPLDMLERPRARPTRPFPPRVIQERMTIQPLLTPDNYPEVVARLIRGARARVLIENQSFSLRKDIEDMPPHFLAIAEAVRDRQEQGLDVRIIFRNGFGKEREVLRRLKEFGIRTDPGHIRFFDTCHTKGIVVDDKHVVLGSQNWTGDGTGPNRDASLLITNQAANAYFAELFEHDWEIVAERAVPQTRSRRPIRVTRSGQESDTPAGYVRIALADFLGDS